MPNASTYVGFVLNEEGGLKSRSDGFSVLRYHGQAVCDRHHHYTPFNTSADMQVDHRDSH